MPALAPTAVTPPATGKNRLPPGNGAGQAQEVTPPRVRQPVDKVAPELIPVDQICPNRYQPRKEFNKDELQALADSIQKDKQLQAIVVRPLAVKDRPSPEIRYELIDGERRLRAIRDNLGWNVIRAEVRRVDNLTSFCLTGAGNVRAGINAIEEAMYYQQGMREFGLNQRELAERLGIKQVAISQRLALLKLPASVQDMLRTGQLQVDVAKQLLDVQGAEARIAVATKVVERGLSASAAAALIMQLNEHQEIRTGAVERRKQHKIKPVSLINVVFAIEQAKKRTARLLDLPGKGLPALCDQDPTVARKLLELLDSWGEDVGMLKEALEEKLGKGKGRGK